jgi:hypothetical protein
MTIKRTKTGHTAARALHDALEFARSGDTLIVWKLDRLARSMKQLIETIENLRVRGIGFRNRGGVGIRLEPVAAMRASVAQPDQGDRVIFPAFGSNAAGRGQI